MTGKRRRQQGTGGLYKTTDSRGRTLWRGAVDLGHSPDGKRIRKVVSSRDRNEATRKLNALRAQVATGQAVATRSPTVADWLAIWLSEVAPGRVRPRTLDGYRGYVTRYILPTLGRRKLDQVQPQHIRAMHKAIINGGERSSTTARQAHAILTRAFADARREGHVCIDVGDKMDPPPRDVVTGRDALTVPQAITLLRAVADDPIGPRVATALFLGARQGECLGLEWDRVDLLGMTVDLAWQLQRLPHRHGCGDTCGHKRAGNCPQRILDVPPGFEYRPTSAPGLYLTRPKSRAGQRAVPLIEPLAQMLARMDRDGPFVFHRPGGAPVDPKDDSRAWHAALASAGLPRAPLHVARHTSATLLRSAGADDRTRWRILGHASAASADAYLHEDDTLAREALDRVGGMLALD